MPGGWVLGEDLGSFGLTRSPRLLRLFLKNRDFYVCEDFMYVHFGHTEKSLPPSLFFFKKFFPVSCKLFCVYFTLGNKNKRIVSLFFSSLSCFFLYLGHGYSLHGFSLIGSLASAALPQQLSGQFNALGLNKQSRVQSSFLGLGSAHFRPSASIRP